MPTADDLLAELAPIAATVVTLDLSDVDGSEATLLARYPDPARLVALLRAASDEGWLTPKRSTDTLTFGRLCRSNEAMHGCSVDVVDMVGEGGEHTHPNGEVSLCIPIDGEPRFDGKPGPWVVKPPGSHHTPTVTGGRMLIAYLLPGGAIRFGPRED
jgi:hypothetical protein